MNKLKDSDKKFADLERMIKPSLTTGIIGSLISLGPYGHLILKIVTKDYSNLLLGAVLVLPTLILMSFYWCWHIRRLKEYRKDILSQANKD